MHMYVANNMYNNTGYNIVKCFIVNRMLNKYTLGVKNVRGQSEAT